jgi:hypothetical protein
VGNYFETIWGILLELSGDFRWNSTSGSLNNKFFQNGGQFTINNDAIVIDLKKKRHLPILLDALEAYQETAIPWLDNRKLIFRPWAVS